jgi:hypothetical protein
MVRGWSKAGDAFHYRREDAYRNEYRDDDHRCTAGVEVHEKDVWYFEGDAGSFKCDLLSIEPNLDVYLVRYLCHELNYILEDGGEDTVDHRITEFLLTDDDTLIIRDLPEG